MHLFFTVFSIAFAVAVYLLAKFFQKPALFCSLFLISCPAFMVLSHNFMTEIAYTSMLLLAFLFHLYGAKKRQCSSIGHFRNFEHIGLVGQLPRYFLLSAGLYYIILFFEKIA